MKQNKLWHDWNGAAAHDLKLYQVGLSEIGAYSGIDFGFLANLDEFEWRQARFRDRARMEPIAITGYKDIEFHGDRRRERGIRAVPFGRPEGDAAAGAAEVGHSRCCGGQARHGDEDGLDGCEDPDCVDHPTCRVAVELYKGVALSWFHIPAEVRAYTDLLVSGRLDVGTGGTDAAVVSATCSAGWESHSNRFHRLPRDHKGISSPHRHFVASAW